MRKNVLINGGGLVGLVKATTKGSCKAIHEWKKEAEFKTACQELAKKWAIRMATGEFVPGIVYTIRYRDFSIMDHMRYSVMSDTERAHGLSSYLSFVDNYFTQSIELGGRTYIFYSLQTIEPVRYKADTITLEGIIRHHCSHDIVGRMVVLDGVRFEGDSFELAFKEAIKAENKVSLL